MKKLTAIQRYHQSERGKIALKRAKEKYFSDENKKNSYILKLRQYYINNKEELNLVNRLNYYLSIYNTIVNTPKLEIAKSYLKDLLEIYKEKLKNNQKYNLKIEKTRKKYYLILYI